MGRRRKYSDSELDDLQRIKKENQSLKRTISSLRKQIARIDIDRYENLKSLLEKEDEQELTKKLEKAEEENNKKWICHSCSNGSLKLIIFSRRDGIFYFRKCDNSGCSNKTKTKRWSEDVEGIR